VFSIQHRYRRDVLDEEYELWIAGFGVWCKAKHGDLDEGDEFADALGAYIAYLECEGFSNLAYLKRAVMEFLRDQCRAGQKNVINVLSYYIRGLKTPQTVSAK
jgi:hypothetical protein